VLFVGFASLAIGSSSVSHSIHCSCLVFVGCKFCNWVKFDVTFNLLVLFSVCGDKFCNWVKFDVTFNSLLLFSVCGLQVL